MTVIAADTASFTTPANDQTHIIVPGVTVGAFSVLNTGVTLINYGRVDQLGADVTGGLEFINRESGVVTDGVFIKAAGSVFNEGLIVGDGISPHGISIQTGANNNVVVNSGDIYGLVGGITVSAGSAVNVSISNSGEIRGDQYGIFMLNAVGAAPSIVNSGTIIGRTNSILATGGDRLNVVNTGTLNGSVMGDSVGLADSVVNNRTIIGDVSLGTGNDRYRGVGTVSGTVFGEEGADNLSGGNATDRLNGGAGNDLIFGGLGNDRLTGGANSDNFYFNTRPNAATNRDVVTDFSRADDTFRMENAVFTGLGPAGTLNSALFRAGAVALDANDRIIYNQANGLLVYDANGNAAGGAVQVAVIQNRPALAFNDFAVI